MQSALANDEERELFQRWVRDGSHIAMVYSAEDAVRSKKQVSPYAPYM